MRRIKFAAEDNVRTLQQRRGFINDRKRSGNRRDPIGWAVRQLNRTVLSTLAGPPSVRIFAVRSSFAARSVYPRAVCPRKWTKSERYAQAGEGEGDHAKKHHGREIRRGLRNWCRVGGWGRGLGKGSTRRTNKNKKPVFDRSAANENYTPTTGVFDRRTAIGHARTTKMTLTPPALEFVELGPGTGVAKKSNPANAIHAYGP